MTPLEKLEIAKNLQDHHYFFRAFWDIGDIHITQDDTCSTAHIAFDSSGESIRLVINEIFWNSLNEHSRMFLICHEMLHIILQHGKRFTETFGKYPECKFVNVAADVVINEMLCDSFGFRRQDLDERLQNKGCWYDTIFPNNTNLIHRNPTEYYFNILLQTPDKSPEVFEMDQHIIMSDEELKGVHDKLLESGIRETIDSNFVDALGPEKMESNGTLFGTGNWSNVSVVKRKVQKWETVIKKWENFHSKSDIILTERWERVSPRYSQLMNGIHLPTECNILKPNKTKDKIDIFFFLDTSGSCIQLKNRFFSAAASIDPDKFNIRLFCFDTAVRETTLKSKQVYGGGGTSFVIIEQAIQKCSKKKYPKAVFIISDGYGDLVKPQYPERWHWFLTTNYTHCINPKSNVYKLSDYE
jgi:hypothetical protein